MKVWVTFTALECSS